MICRAVAIGKSSGTQNEVKISFKDATDLCRDFYRTPNASGEKLLQDISKYTYSNKKGRKAERGTIKSKTFVAFTYRTSA